MPRLCCSEEARACAELLDRDPDPARLATEQVTETGLPPGLAGPIDLMAQEREQAKRAEADHDPDTDDPGGFRRIMEIRRRQEATEQRVQRGNQSQEQRLLDAIEKFKAQGMIEAAALAAGSLKQVRQAQAITDSPENPSEAWPPLPSLAPRVPNDMGQNVAASR